MTGQPATFNPPIGEPPSIELIPPARESRSWRRDQPKPTRKRLRGDDQ